MIIDDKITALQDFLDHIYDYVRMEVIEDEAVICDMNSESQLYERGIDRDGDSISSYSPYTARTVMVKLLKHQPTNRVTLRDTGEFHASFRVVVDDIGFYIDATDWKTSELEKKYGKQIFGLTEENINELVWDYIYPMLVEKAKQL